MEKLLKLLPDQPNTRKSNEGTEQIDSVRTKDLERHLRTDLKVLVSVDEQCAVPKWYAGPRQRPSRGATWSTDFEQQSGFRPDGVMALPLRSVRGQHLERPVS